MHTNCTLFCTNNKDFQKHNSHFSMLFKIKAIIVIFTSVLYYFVATISCPMPAATFNDF